MSAGATVREQCRQTTLTAAYLDGELDARATALFEAHLKECRACSEALREQRRLLCLLDAAFDETFGQKGAPSLPDAFTREVKARAQNDLSGVRAPGERARALKICAVLALAAFALLGFTALDTVIEPVWKGAHAAGRVLGVAGRAAADAGAGAGLVLRAAGGKLSAGSQLLLALQWAALVAGLILLLLLITRYHRAGASD